MRSSLSLCSHRPLADMFISTWWHCCSFGHSSCVFFAAACPNITCNFPYGWFIFCRRKDIFVLGMWRNAVVWHQTGAEQRERSRDFSSSLTLLRKPCFKCFLVFNLFCLGLLSWQRQLKSSPPPTARVLSTLHLQKTEAGEQALQESAAPPSWLKKSCNVCFPGCSGLL